MSRIYFFADPGALNPQTDSRKAFGPSSENQYRVDSIHNTFGSNAYAVCDGQVRYQPTDDDETLNIILKPSGDIQFNGIPIKYFIYKGIMKSSVIDSENMIINHGIEEHLGDKMHVRMGTISDMIGTTLQPFKDILGVIFSSTASGIFHRKDTESIDSIFFENTPIKPIDVSAGTILGIFQTGDIGFQIVLEGENFDPKLKIARTASHVYDVNTLSGLQPIQIRTFRDEVLNYLDPITFYTMYYHEGVYVAGDDLPAKEGVLFKRIADKFLNKHRVYIDIRNEQGTSFNYYGAYSKTSGPNLPVKIWGYKNSTPVTASEYTTMGWPILIRDGGDPALFDQDQNPKKKSYMQLAFPVSNTVNSLDEWILFLACSQRKGGQKPKMGRDFFEEVNFTDDWTDPVKLSNYKHNNGKTVSFYHRIHYIRICETSASNTFEISKYVKADKLFTLKPLAQYVKWQAPEMKTRAWRLGGMRYIRPEGSTTPGIMVETWVARDETRIVYFTVPVAYNDKRSANTQARNVQKSLSGETSFFQAYHTGEGKDFKLIKHALITPSSGTKRCLTFVQNADINSRMTSINTALKDATYSTDGFFAIALTAAEYANVESAMTSQALTYAWHAPVFLEPQSSTQKHDLHPVSIDYYDYTFKVIGLNVTSGFVSQTIQNSGVNMLFYTTTEQTFCTDAAATAEPESESSEPLAIIIDVSNSGYPDLTRLTEELQQALLDVKQYVPNFYKELLSVIQVGRNVPVPEFTSGVDSIYFETSVLKKVKYKIRISFQDLATIDPAYTLFDGLTDYGYYKNPVGDKNSTDLINGLKVEPTRLVDEYASLYSTNTPKQLKAAMESKWVFRIKTGEDVVVEKDIKSIVNDTTYNGICALSHTDVISITLNRRITDFSLGSPKFLKDDYFYANIEGEADRYIALPPGSSTIEGTPLKTFLNKHSLRRMFWATTLVHELAHAMFAINNPIEAYAWKLLETAYPSLVPPLPPKKGGGHAKGNATGIAACTKEYELQLALTNDFGKKALAKATEYNNGIPNPSNHVLTLFDYITDATLNVKVPSPEATRTAWVESKYSDPSEYCSDTF